MRQLITTFLDESAQLMREMREAIAAGDPVRLGRSAHSLKGAVGIFGVASATEAAEKLELLGKAKSLAGAAETYQELERAVHGLRSGLAELTAASSL